VEGKKIFTATRRHIARSSTSGRCPSGWRSRHRYDEARRYATADAFVVNERETPLE